MSIENRLVRYKDLKPCTNAFIDTRSPGSDKKENFTVIGPGVAENPDQHVHISIPHGFNIGGARQPAGCLNSQHSHLTEEVFVIHFGDWDFISGVNADDGRIRLHKGDIISIPMDIFRGFENVGQGLGYLHAVLGSDDPGRVTWAPSVFEMAKEYGLVLLEDGSLVDTTLGETIPDGAKVMPVTSKEEIAKHRVVGSEAMNDIIIRTKDFPWSTDTVLSKYAGVEEAGLVGPSNEIEGIVASKLNWNHGFVVRALKLQAGAQIPQHTRSEEEVIFVHQGTLDIIVDDQAVTLSEGDNFTTPIDSVRQFNNNSEAEVIVYITRRGDHPQAPVFI
ncbi:cupin domain-containing protein [Thalassomonas sp. M1454]|uniref:cupin domain-containing protein n=1 Tax=Thalassomonas sp. M1454 TaxID=2594477 RepID=UPI00117E33EE|nr:cupin domain-containing protein [Thalassomonas sp. M1454]TRX56775.1 cupin domain-containing protein [Thalassomonas sp. M1454]